jgi:hypothetical protein
MSFYGTVFEICLFLISPFLRPKICKHFFAQIWQAVLQMLPNFFRALRPAQPFQILNAKS